MKFPKSVHAEGWDNHIDTVPSDKPAGTPLRAIKARSTSARIDPNAPLNLSASDATESGAPIATPRVERSEPYTASQPEMRAAALPPHRENRLSWMIGAGAGAAVLAAAAMWAMNRPAEAPDVPPVMVSQNAEPQAASADTVTAAAPAADAAPDTAPAAEATSPEPATVAAATAAQTEAAPPRVGLPVTTSRPAAEARPVAQARQQEPVPAARPDMVVRAAPSSPAAVAPNASALPPSTTIAAAPVTAAVPATPTTDVQPPAVTPGTAPIVVPPTAAGPLAAATPQPDTAPATPAQALTAPVAAATPEPAVISTSPGTPALPQDAQAVAQAQPQPQAQPQAQAQPAPEDSGITAQVRTALAADSTLAAVPIVVTTDGGVVKLEGEAPDAPTRERATVVASAATGVRAVDNRLTVPATTIVSQAPAAVQ